MDQSRIMLDLVQAQSPLLFLHAVDRRMMHDDDEGIHINNLYQAVSYVYNDACGDVLQHATLLFALPP